MQFSLNDKHIIVNYHYVEDPREDFSGAKPCPIDFFERQITFLKQHYRITSIPNVFEAAQVRSSERICALTFDDGLKDQYQNAVPILARQGVTATFFCISGTLEGFLPASHAVHTLLSRERAENLVEKLNAFFKNLGEEKQYHIPLDKRISEKRKLRDDIATANFKETINALPPNIERASLEYLLGKSRLDEKTLSMDLFMNGDEIKDLAARGFTIGSHGHHHYALDLQTKSVVQDEIEKAKEKLIEATGATPIIFSYPHGGTNDNTRDTLKEAGFSYATTIAKEALGPDTDPLLIPRFDVFDINA